MKYAPTTQSGFSLVETLVAITILLLVIVGPMTISSSTARSTSFSSEQVVAFFLAQEGAELAQKARDDLLLADFTNPQNAWNSFVNSGVFSSCFNVSTGCGLEFVDNGSIGDTVGALKAPVSCTGTNCRLYFDSTGGRSRYTLTSTATTSPFTRVITMTPDATLPNPPNSDDAVKVTSKVTWRTGSQRAEQEVSVETYLFNVYGN